MSLSVRAATSGDLPRILELLAQDSFRYYGDADDDPLDVTDRQREAFREIDADPNQDLLVGEVDGRVIATAQVSWMRVLTADGGLLCQVEAVRVDEAMRGRGLGAELMALIESVAVDRGAARLQLTSNALRNDAHRFYERLGYAASHVGFKKYV